MRAFLLLFVLINSQFQLAKAEIFETESIENLYPYITCDSLVIFDFDNTLVDTTEPLGSKHWRDWIRIRVAKMENEEDIPKLLIAKHLTNLARFIIPMRPMEGAKTTNLIKALKENNTPFLILTARTKDFLDTVTDGFAKASLKQLRSSGIEIPAIEDLKDSSIYEGILFTCEQEKGPFLVQTFKENNYFPKRILFLDNSLENIKSVEGALARLGIESFTFHYTYLNPKWQNFDPLVANIQLEVFLKEGRVPHEDEARRIKATLKEQDAEIHFKHLIQAHYQTIIKQSFIKSRTD